MAAKCSANIDPYEWPEGRYCLHLQTSVTLTLLCKIHALTLTVLLVVTGMTGKWCRPALHSCQLRNVVDTHSVTHTLRVYLSFYQISNLTCNKMGSSKGKLHIVIKNFKEKMARKKYFCFLILLSSDENFPLLSLR